jgi:DNA recombination protein RmuC
MEIGLLIVLILGIGAVIFLLVAKKDSGKDERMTILMEKISNLSGQNERLREVMDNKLKETHQANQNQLFNVNRTIQNISNQSSKLISDITEKLTKLDDTNKQVINFSAQLQNLQDILKNPKQRGILGEYFLEETLKNVLPPGSYKMQYEFKDGLIVDAVVFVKEKVIPIDSKFSLENYERILNTSEAGERESLEKSFKQDLKNRIDETSKYIKPEEGTMEFAFMFIPSEAIYYDLLVNKVGAVKIDTRSMIEYAFRDKHVIIVSPTSFLAYLQTVLQGLRAMEIEENAKEVIVNVEKLKKHALNFDSFMKKIGDNLQTTFNSYNNAYKELGKLDKDMAKITQSEKIIEPELLDKPSLGEE